MAHLDADLAPDVRESIAYAFRELLLNAIEWGGRLDPESQGAHRLPALEAHADVSHRRSGPGFDIDDLPHAAIGQPPDDPIAHMQVREDKGLRPGGFGLLTVRDERGRAALQRKAQRSRVREIPRRQENNRRRPGGHMRRAQALSIGSLVLTLAAAATGAAQAPSGTGWDARAAAGYLDARMKWWLEWRTPRAITRRNACRVTPLAVPALARPALRAVLGEREITGNEQLMASHVATRVRLWNEVEPMSERSAFGVALCKDERIARTREPS